MLQKRQKEEQSPSNDSKHTEKSLEQISPASLSTQDSDSAEKDSLEDNKLEGAALKKPMRKSRIIILLSMFGMVIAGCLETIFAKLLDQKVDTYQKQADGSMSKV